MNETDIKHIFQLNQTPIKMQEIAQGTEQQ